MLNLAWAFSLKVNGSTPLFLVLYLCCYNKSSICQYVEIAMYEHDPIACYALTSQGLNLAHILADKFNLHIYAPEKLCSKNKRDERAFNSLTELIKRTFHSYAAHIFITASGIAVRSIAPHLVHKGQDPAVIVCDERGHYAISLLSGHWGGANELSKDIAKYLAPSHDTKPVITTATDINNMQGIDVLAKEHACIVLDWPKVKTISAAMLNKQIIQLYDPWGIFKLVALENVDFQLYEDLNLIDLALPSVGIDWKVLPDYEHFLRLSLPALCVGIGCKRGTSKEEILHAIVKTFAENQLELRAIACLASAEIKSNEKGLVQAAKELGVPLHLFEAKNLANAPCLNPSTKAAKLLNVERVSVSEGGALLAAGVFAKLIVPKVKYNQTITIAVAHGCFA